MRLLMAAALLVSGCAIAAPELSPSETAAATAAGIEAPVALKVESHGTGIERLMALTKDYDEAPAAGIVLSTAPGQGRTSPEALRSDLKGSPFRAYLRDDAFGHGPDKIAVVAANDLGYLAIVRTDGINHDLDHEQVLARYKQWHEKYGLELVGAGQDWLEARFVRPPADWDAFAKEVYAFCPDVVDQGTTTVEALAQEMKAGNLVYLWWD